jgi:hypothetical protein
MNGLLTAHYDGSLNYVLKFSNIARPSVLCNFLNRLLGEAVNLLVVPGCVFGQKMRRQGRDILAALS